MESPNVLCWCCQTCAEKRAHPGRTVNMLYNQERKGTSSPHSGGALSPEPHPGVPQSGTSPGSPHHHQLGAVASENCEETGEVRFPMFGDTLISQLLQDGLSPYHSALVGINNYPVRYRFQQ